MPERLNGVDANDVLYASEASPDYNPEPGLEGIRARVFAINTEDDPTNSPEPNILPEAIQRLDDGKYVLIPRSQETGGHGSYRLGRLYADCVREILR